MPADLPPDRRGALLADLRSAVGAEHVLVDPDLTTAYGTDWTRRWSTVPLAVVRPASTAEVATVVMACASRGVPVVAQGGNTGLVGGSVPHAGRPAVVLSTRRLVRVDAVDTAARQVVVGAGVTLATLQRHAAEAGLRYAVDLAARDTATAGGMVATNAGGLRVVAFGDTRRQVVGVEAVLADGSVVSRLGGLAKDNSGYDLAQLLVGSEGTLGIVTAVRLRLLAPPSASPQVVLVGLPDVAAALPWVRTPGLTAAEVMLDRGLGLVEEVAGLRPPLAERHPVTLLLEIEGELPEELADHDTAVGAHLWEYRERHSDAIATRGSVHKLDVAVPVVAVPALVESIDRALGGALSDPAATQQAYVFGHLGDGNLHVNLGRGEGIAALRDVEELERLVFGLVHDLGGSVAAEHGVGVAKRPWLSMSRSPAELAAMRAVKGALDPDGLLNPGVLLP